MTTSPSTPNFDALLAHSGWVRSLARSLVADSTTADDIEQQAWLTALERPPSHDRNLRSWWFTVVRSSAGKGWREQSRRREVEDELAAYGADSEAISPAGLAERLETFQRLAAAVAQLPEPYGAVIYLRYFEELPIREVARRQEVLVDTAQSRINTGLKHLRSALRQNLGAQWRQRCQVFALPMSAAPWYTAGSMAFVTAALKTPFGIAATVLALFSLVAWAPWEDDAPEVIQEIPAALTFTEAEQNVEPGIAIDRTVVEPYLAFGSGFNPAAKDGSLITVVDSNGMQPLPGAEVIVLDLGVLPLPEEAFEDFERIGVEEMLLAMGDRYRTDDKAQVRIPAPSGKLILVGRTTKHFRFLNIPSLTESAVNGEDILLAVDLVDILPVKVIDQNGEAVEGAHVNLRLFDEEFEGGFIGALTNAQGQAWIKILGGLQMDPERKQFFAHLNILSAQPILAEVDIYNLPKEPVVLVMPPSGQVEIVIRDASGRPVNGHFIAALGSLAPSREGQPDQEIVVDGIMMRATQGHALFPFVALNQKLRGLAVSRDYSFQAMTTADGPVEVGETVVVSIAPAMEWSFITGRVLNTEGMIAKNLSLKLDIARSTREGEDTSRQAIQTDSEGRFRLQIDNEFQPESTRKIIVVMGKTKRKARRIAEKDLSRPLAPGDTDLGDFIVATPPILVQGQVLSFSGQPVAGASVDLDYEQGPRTSFTDVRGRASGGTSMAVSAAPDSNHVNWQQREDLSVETDDEGRFTIYARAQDCRYRVVAHHRDHKRAEKEFVPGATDFEMNLGATIIIGGRILLDSIIPIHGIHVTLLTPRPNDPSDYYGYGIFVNSRGYYEFRGQEQGTYGLRIQSNWLDEEFFFISPQDLLPVNGKYTFPDIDLRGCLAAIQVRIVDEQGKLIPKGRIGKVGQPWMTPFEFQPLQLVSQSNEFHFQIAVEGRRQVVLKGAMGDQEVVMHKGIPVRVVIDNFEALPADWDLSTAVYGVDDNGSQSERRPAKLTLNSAGMGRTDFAWPGTFRLAFQVIHARNNESIHRWIPFLGESNTPDFVVLDQDELQEIHFKLDPVKLENAIQEARRYEQEWDNRDR